MGAHLLLVPRFGPVGAAAATTILACLGAGAAMLVMHRHYEVRFALNTFLRIAVAAVIAYILSRIWPVSGLWVLVKLSVMTAVTVSCLFLLGVLTKRDFLFVRSLFRPGRNSPK